MLRLLIGAGPIGQRDGRWVSTKTIDRVDVPVSLQALLAARLDQLSPPVKRTLQRAAVGGKVFYPEALAALGVEGSPEELLVPAARRAFVFQRTERGPGPGRGGPFRPIPVPYVPD